MPVETVTVLHLSDLQFGLNQRFLGRDPIGLPNAHDTLLQRLKSDLEDISLQVPDFRKPDIIVVTGDLAEWGMPLEFDAAVTFIEGLRQFLGLAVGRVAIVPGNHDVNRHDCEAYFSTCKGEGTQPVPPWFPKWKHFHTKLKDYLGGGFTPAQPWSFYELADLGVVIGGINSTMVEGHDIRKAPAGLPIPHHHGWIGEDQLRWFATKLAHYRHMGWLRLAVVHHNQQRGCFNDDANLKDGEALADGLGPTLNALLHGHSHNPTVRWLDQHVPILAAGSAGVIAAERPEEVPLQYQILQFSRESLRRISRVYVPLQHRWCADLTTGRDGISEYAIRFDSVAHTFGKAHTSVPLQPPAPLPSAQGALSRVADPHAVIRVSMAALLKLELNGSILLVRNLYRKNTFSPFGGVYKVWETANAILDSMGFAQDRLRETTDELARDLDRDLRGCLPVENFERFLAWFRSQRERELHDSCLRRELHEELLQAGLAHELADDVDHMSFTHLRTVEEGPVPLDGFFLYRHLEVYQLALNDPNAGPRNRRILEHWFDKATGPHVAIVTANDVDKKVAPSGESLAPPVLYLFSNRPNPAPTSTTFSRSVALPDAAQLFGEFFASGLSKSIDPKTAGTSVQLLHRINKLHSRSLVGALEIDGRPCVVKYYPDGNHYLAKEAWALERLHGKVSVPKIVEHHGTKNGPSFMILERVEGRPMSSLSASEQIELLPLVVREALRLRALRFADYGEVVGSFDPVPNQKSLDAYVRSMVAHWRKQLMTLPEAERKFGDLSPLVEWSNAVADGGPCPVWSVLADQACLCHSDVKPHDVFVCSTPEGTAKVVLLDFDNVFAFVPEFDLCKLHFGLVREGVRIPLNELARIVAEADGTVTPAAVYDSLVSVYPYVMVRLLHWAMDRRSEFDIDLMARVLPALELPPRFGFSIRPGSGG